MGELGGASGLRITLQPRSPGLASGLPHAGASPVAGKTTRRKTAPLTVGLTCTGRNSSKGAGPIDRASGDSWPASLPCQGPTFFLGSTNPCLLLCLRPTPGSFPAQSRGSEPRAQPQGLVAESWCMLLCFCGSQGQAWT